MSRIYRHRRHGLSLAEALVALAICAALLACMAMAFSAAGNAVEMNDHFYRSLQQARTGMDMIVTTLRRCQSVGSVSSSSLTYTANPSDFPGTGTVGDSLTITYNNASASTNPNTITLTDNTTGITSILVGENSNTDAEPVVVSSASFDGSTAANGAIGVTLTVQIGQYPIMNQITLSGSAAPRVNLTSAFQ
jgi:hypothetical protein